MLRNIAICLVAAALLAAPASAQVNRQTIRPGGTVVQSALPAAAGNASLAGVWHTTGVICARWTLAKDANRKITGSMRMGTCGVPEFTGAEFVCEGFQHANSQFQLVCNHPSGQFFVFMGRVVVDDPILTQRRTPNAQAVGPAYPAARVEGRMHQAYFTGEAAPAYLIDHAIAATRAS